MKNYIILFTLVLTCCNSKSHETEISNDDINATSTISIYDKKYNDIEKIEELKKAIKIKGDTVAFNTLQEIYILSSHEKEFLYLSMYMANAYNYHEAYYTNYFILKTDIINSKNKLNNQYANYYLLKAYELGNIHAKYSVSERFKNQDIPSSKEYLKLMINDF